MLPRLKQESSACKDGLLAGAFLWAIGPEARGQDVNPPATVTLKSGDRLPIRWDKTMNVDTVAYVNRHQVFAKLNRTRVALSHKREDRSRYCVEV